MASEVKYRKIFDRVLKEIKPTKLEVRANIANTNILMNKLKRIVPKSVEVRVTGSLARGTNLRGDADVDIFLLFDRKLSKDQIVKAGVSYGKRLVTSKREHYEIKYAEHPYVRVFFDDLGIKADIVPAYKIRDIQDMGTAVDRTPMHTEFINKSLTSKQRDDVRLLKYMLKSHNIYGAEIEVAGFSGYLCELLIYHFGSFAKLLEHASNFTLPIVIIPGSKPKNEQELVKKFNSRFVVVDPIDKDRNVAAVVSMESLSKFVLIAKSFTTKPAIDAFYGLKFSSNESYEKILEFLDSTDLDIFTLMINLPSKSVDTLWPQLRKVAGILEDYIKRFDFKTYFTMVWMHENTGFISFVTPKQSIGTRLNKGPSVFIKKASDEFLNKHKGSFGTIIQGENIYSLDKNKYSTMYELMSDIAEGNVIKKHKDIKLASKLFMNDIPKDHAEEMYIELRKKLTI